jgi:hypothetical protein
MHRHAVWLPSHRSRLRCQPVPICSGVHSYVCTWTPHCTECSRSTGIKGVKPVRTAGAQGSAHLLQLCLMRLQQLYQPRELVVLRLPQQQLCSVKVRRRHHLTTIPVRDTRGGGSSSVRCGPLLLSNMRWEDTQGSHRQLVGAEHLVLV